MSLQVLASQAQRPDTIAHVKRKSTNYTPSIWGDHFLSYATKEVDIKLEKHVRELKEEVKRMLMDPVKKPSQKLDLVDDIQRLGVSYHFENEIDEILKQIHHSYSYGSVDDLYTTALRFRLLRQQGYNVSCDIFNKFKEENDQKFKASLLSDVSGLLSLYEATHLRIHGEDILEEALAFTTTHLESVKHSLSPSLSKQVAHSLNQPLRKGIPRVEARYYLSIYQECDSHNKTLLTFAKLDFNLLQKLHQKELCEITRWWKDLDVRNKLPFTRDRITEIYFIWSLSAYFEPQYSFARRTSCKVTAILSIVDDIYDNCGTLEELELFTEAIQRWDIRATDPLPDYMKVCYKAMLEVYTEIEEELAKEGKLYRIHYAREAMKKQVKSYFLEAKWLHHQHIPTMDEYMVLSLETTAYLMLITISFVGMGDIATQDSFNWLATYPKAVKGAAVVCRLMDDIADHKFEQNRGYVTSAVECYMKEYGATEEEAITGLRRQVSDAWKDINESFLLPNVVPRPLLIRILNLACAMDVAYKNEDGYTTHHESVIKDFVVSTLVQSVPV
ncbi:putative lyase [Rosa chinensis]|uniref:Putative lyase n=1 Tax=Rosa chinensis TaxID=74649 RepID=A0A2P6QHG9_ROSCH|nr:(-)-germacrene D synthase [Rosa chinensis]XP_024160318.1 (-)-germacrene D synthase [Rosa chinensis]PRQ33610.1 putative lyase [Rosa chinensis]PRQ33611.1 putative lyase [Rosa chinensis]